MSANSIIRPVEFGSGANDPPSNVVDIPPQPESRLLRIGGEVWQEAPSGKYTAKCTKVDPDWRFMNNRKLALYFTVIEGEFSGARARYFFPKRSRDLAIQTGSDFGPKSKLFQVIKKLFPGILAPDGKVSPLDPCELFLKKVFEITVELRKGRNRESTGNAIVIDISHFDPGW